MVAASFVQNLIMWRVCIWGVWGFFHPSSLMEYSELQQVRALRPHSFQKKKKIIAWMTSSLFIQSSTVSLSSY